jgi:hypothetical protein
MVVGRVRKVNVVVVVDYAIFSELIRKKMTFTLCCFDEWRRRQGNSPQEAERNTCKVPLPSYTFRESFTLILRFRFSWDTASEYEHNVT